MDVTRSRTTWLARYPSAAKRHLSRRHRYMGRRGPTVQRRTGELCSAQEVYSATICIILYTYERSA